MLPIVYMIQGGVLYNSEASIFSTMINILFIIVTSLLFFRKKENSHQQKIHTMKIPEEP